MRISGWSSDVCSSDLSNYWNPFGPVTFANGAANPNRLAGIDAPVGGLPVAITSYRFADLGPTIVDVTNRQLRTVLGLRGATFGFNWESGLVYPEATVRDVQDGTSATALQQSLALSTPNAYTHFNVGNQAGPQDLDATTKDRMRTSLNSSPLRAY